jgi:hypothetical protein
MKTLKVLIILGLFSPVSTWAQASVDGLTEEEKEIMQVITEQTRSYFERDFESWKNTMSNN